MCTSNGETSVLPHNPQLSPDMPNVIPSTDQLTGQIIDGGRLCLIDPLGHGSGGVVFRALDLCSSSPYAVKCMVKAEVDSRQASFQMREIRLHTAVSSHPNVVTLHRVVEEDGYIFLVLDYCAGGDLFKYLTQRGTFVRNDALVKGAMCQLIDALEACHKRGVFHRDIKPENIMCSRDGTQLKLGDFGLATDSLRSRNFGAGTSGYMSPGMSTLRHLYFLLTSFQNALGPTWDKRGTIPRPTMFGHWV